MERANAALLARANRASDRSFGQRGGHLLHQDESLCVATAQGVWAIALEGFRVERGDQEGLLATGLLTWRPNAGRASAGVRIGFRTDGNSGDETMLVPAADYDNDGTPEVIVHRRERDSEAGGHHTRRVFTARAGTLEPYSPAARFLAVDGVVDADRDGRPDLVLESPWGASSRCGYMGETHHGPALLAHALPDGTFSTRDDVTRAWTLSRCVRGGGQWGRSPDVLDVACAHPRGVVRVGDRGAAGPRARGSPPRHRRGARGALPDLPRDGGGRAGAAALRPGARGRAARPIGFEADRHHWTIGLDEILSSGHRWRLGGDAGAAARGDTSQETCHEPTYGIPGTWPRRHPAEPCSVASRGFRS
ncbi:MAG: VCBS repeat-containing protein [Deltaproteobacteria bacterium]|nr:VCBS repeat-containing protein [Deltaproteobacteria bacterium]